MESAFGCHAIRVNIMPLEPYHRHGSSAASLFSVQVGAEPLYHELRAIGLIGGTA